ncbi:hypothetical protein G7Z17_g6876 [Cylindrodendrum hubeiense]|uniref:BZIP domain-containing protein n=1 Tax=Cylindrodendrum hubeiense TaxID=595255 RepID=A0A9P5HA45_9HYPO|nr:hypothetical protein G7Z17_g6876 [Cylindrodendrum hubeiense]
MASAASGSVSRSYGDGLDASRHRQFPPLDAMDEGTFDENNALVGDPTLDTFNVAPDLPWEQWWATDQSTLVGSVPDGGAMTPAYVQTSFLPDGYVCGYDTNSLDHSAWPSPATEYTAMSSVAGQAVFKESPASSGVPQPPRTEKEARRRKRNPDENPSRKSTKRSSVRSDDTNTRSRRDSEQSKNHRGSGGNGTGSKNDDKHDAKASKSSKAGNKTKAKDNKSSKDSSKTKNTSKIDSRTDNGEGSSISPQGFPESPGDDNDRSTRIQQRNRIASNKFRVKKREDAMKLKSEEEDMERINRDLSNRVAGLTHEVYDLKMQLLRHTDCGCSMIQNFIVNEAHRYIRGIEVESSQCTGHHDREA